jgi:hypothetical protein
MRMCQYDKIQLSRIERKRIMIAGLIGIASLEHAAVDQETAVVSLDVKT